VAGITNLTVYFDDRKMGETTAYPPQYNFIVLITNDVPGDFEVRAKGADETGAIVSSEPLLLHYPSVATARFLFPTNGATVFFGKEIRIQVEPIFDRGELTAMSIYYPDALGQYFFDESPPYELAWQPREPGTYTFSASPWFGYYGYGKAAEKVTLTILPESVAYFTREPSDGSLRRGGPFWLFANAVSRGEQRFQWLLNGVPIAGATNFLYAVESASAADAGNYSVIVDNFAGRASSRVARMEFNDGTAGGGRILFSNIGLEKDAPIIASPPGSYFRVDLVAGPALDQMDRYYLNTIATNGYFNAGAITLSNVPPGGKAFVQAMVYKSIEMDPSRSKIIEMTAGGEEPARMTGFESFEVASWDYYRLQVRIDDSTTTNIYEGSSGRLKATAYQNFVPVDEQHTNVWFQWRKNGQTIPGATNAVLRLENVKIDDAGWYSALVTDQILVREAGIAISVLHSIRFGQSDKDEIKLSARAGGRYTIETSQDLQTWAFWKSLTADGEELAVPVTPPAFGQIFYRVIAEP
jgi:hypothetical protein